ncbi:GNAT family N-acetyltransferase [Streptomyces sp. NBC_00237]|uniref:GNAT family N-acetyltransferase n=1 Tax=Streptomyces sp. NBC_00237 TaxID=2975687 RepID=UPI0022565496|nr:GNAT family N-acetyltransferase [Streptomyces sp. NBC_00237]MCX5201562.1 GNAT family N-acetyltransferase [Streptomyces sp. NBC_00237]
MPSSLRDILSSVAQGQYPAPDGRTVVVPQPSPRDAGVLAFTAHSVIFSDQDPEWIRETLAQSCPDPFSASLHPAFLAALMVRTGRRMDTVGSLTLAPALPGPPPLELTEIEDQDHPRVARARRYRDDVRVWSSDGGGILVIGRGLAGRWETAIEVDEESRHRGLGRALAESARHLIPLGDVIWSQQAPGNARSVRAFQAAGYRPVGAEALLIAA